MGGADMTTRLALIRDRNPLALLERLPGWWTGKIITRQALIEQAASDKESDEHHRLIAEYQRRAMAAGRIA
jgi:hypothetical protein